MATAPTREILERRGFARLIDGSMEKIREIPYPPNFRRMAARIIDPAIGASTCALGSHRWTENIGSFTKNPAIKMIEHKILFDNSPGTLNSKVRDIIM